MDNWDIWQKYNLTSPYNFNIHTDLFIYFNIVSVLKRIPVPKNLGKWLG